MRVGENVGAGDVSHFEDAARWREASDKGMASDFIDSLPAGFETQLGKWFNDGRELSGGQWQKIALARAFMRSRADILVLDEPTAAMDAQRSEEHTSELQSLMRISYGVFWLKKKKTQKTTKKSQAHTNIIHQTLRLQTTTI